MARVKRGTKRRQRHKRLLNLAEGYYGGKHRLFRSAKEAVDRALVYAYTGRKQRKRSFRQLWQTRIGASATEAGISYSRLMAALQSKKVGLNRKMLAELAATEPKDFAQLVAFVRS